MQHDLQLAAAGLGHVGGELLHVLGLEAGRGVAGGQVPLGLGEGAGGERGAGEREGEAFHRGLSRDVVGGFQKLASWWFSRSVISIAPGAWVMQNSGRACAMAAWGVTPQAQNTGSSSGFTSTASP